MKVDQQIMNDKEAKAKKVQLIKEYAKNFFVAGKFEMAKHKYGQSLSLCELKEELPVIYSNMAMCSLKMFKFEDAYKEI